MYLSHFGLKHYPFEKTLGSDELLDTESQAEARARIAHLVELRGPDRHSSTSIARHHAARWLSLISPRYRT